MDEGKIKRKYCDVGLKILATIRRGETRKWANVAQTCASLDAHYANCKRGCGREIEGEWPPR